MKDSSGRFLIVDGIAGSGKSTLLKHLKEEFRHEGARVFDLKDWCAKHRTIPTFDDAKDADILFTYEPTGSWIGEAIRLEMSQKEHPYSAISLAQAFSLDRLVLYNRLIIPARNAGKPIIQDRSFTSSIVYQTTMENPLSLESLLDLPGNRLALEHPPNHLILTDLDPELAISRASKRKELSKGVFQELELLQKIDSAFKAPWFENLLKDAGIKIHRVSTDQPQTDSIKEFSTLIHTLLL